MLGRTFQSAIPRNEVNERARVYVAHHDTAAADAREKAQASIVQSYYDMVTDFYEIGWGPSFHFAPMAAGESHHDAIMRHEHGLALQAGIRHEHQVLDVGCGVGGPMRNIARLTGAHIVGLNNNTYQIERAELHNRRYGLDGQCELVHGDFFSMPFSDERFDVVYDLETTCHASPRRIDAFAEIFRVLKPGGLFATFQWCMTDRYIPGNPEHEHIKYEIQKGNALNDIDATDTALAALQQVGFRILEAKDYAKTGDRDRPWYAPLGADVSIAGFMRSRVGTRLTHELVRVLEALRLSPRGTTEIHDVLLTAQRGLVRAGRMGIFTPMYFCLAKKPSAERGN